MGRNSKRQFKNSERSPSNHQHGKGSKKSKGFTENAYHSKRDNPHHQEKPAPQGKPRTILAFFDSELSGSKKSIKAFDVNSGKDYCINRKLLVDEQGQPVDASLLNNGRLLKLTLDENGSAIKAKFTSESDISISEESKETPGNKKKKGWEKKNEATTPSSEIEVRDCKVISIGEKIQIACEDVGLTRKFHIEAFYFPREPNIGDEVRVSRKEGEIVEVSFIKEGESPARKAPAKSALGNNSGSEAKKSDLSQVEFPALSSDQMQLNTQPSNPPQSSLHIPPSANPLLQVDNPSSSQHSIYQKEASKIDSFSNIPYSDPRPNTISQPLPSTLQTPSNPPPETHAPQYSNHPNVPSFPPPPIPTQITALPSRSTSTLKHPGQYSAIPPYTTPSFSSQNPASNQYEPSTISTLNGPTTNYTANQSSYHMPAPEIFPSSQSNPYSSSVTGQSSSPFTGQSISSYPTQASENPASSHSNPYSSPITGPSSSYPMPAPNNPQMSQPNPYSGQSSQISSSIAHLMPYNPEKSQNIPPPCPPPALSPVMSPIPPVGYIGDDKLAVDMLKSISPSDPHFISKIEILSRSYESVRLLKKDGNSFYLALGVLYLEHLCSRSTSIPEFEYFTKRLDILYQDSTLSSVPDLIYFIESCTNLLRIKINFTSAVDPLQDYFKDVKFVKGMVIAHRNLSAKYLEMAFGDVRFRNMFRGNVIERIRHYGVEAEKDEYLAIAYAFGVSVRVVTIGQEIKLEKYEPGDAYVSTMIYIMNINGHHDILYTNHGH